MIISVSPVTGLDPSFSPSMKDQTKTAGINLMGKIPKIFHKICFKRKVKEIDIIEQIFAEKVNRLASKGRIDAERSVVVKLSRRKYGSLSRSCFVIKEPGKEQIRILQQFHKRLGEFGQIGNGSYKIVYALESLNTGKVTDVRAVIRLSQRAFKGAIAAFVEFGNEPNLCTGHYLTYTSKKSSKTKEVFLSPYMSSDLRKLNKILDRKMQFKAMKQICSALKTMHDKGWIHRDIKTGNCFANYDSPAKTVDVKLGDFDFAEKITDDAKIKDMGTPLFMAPELFNENLPRGVEAGKKCDIYSLGMTFWEISEKGVPSFNCECSTDTFVTAPISYDELYERYFPYPHRQTDLQALIHKMINPVNPMSRPTIDEVIDELKNIVS